MKKPAKEEKRVKILSLIY